MCFDAENECWMQVTISPAAVERVVYATLMATPAMSRHSAHHAAVRLPHFLCTFHTKHEACHILQYYYSITQSLDHIAAAKDQVACRRIRNLLPCGLL